MSRHGETLENKQDIMQGHMPGTLSPLGIQQAEELAELLAKEPIDVIISSDLKRSCDTARTVAEKKNMNIHTTPLLREMDWGRHTGGKLSELDWYNLPEGCETLEELLRRAAACIEWLKKEYSGMRILAVGHGAINRAITAHLEQKSATDMIDMPIMKNTAIQRFELH